MQIELELPNNPNSHNENSHEIVNSTPIHALSFYMIDATLTFLK